MEASWTADRLKTLQPILACLGKLADVLNIHAVRIPADGPNGSEETTVRLSAINSTSSAFFAFILGADFFEHVRVRGGRECKDGSRKLDCQVNIRSLMASLKTSSTQRKLERCEMTITEEGECRIAIRLHHQHGVTKIHKLTYESQSALFPSANPDPGSAIVVSPQSALEWLQHFAATGRGADMSLWCSADHCSVKSKSDEFETAKMRKSIQTEVKVELTSFEVYHVAEEVFLTFPLKEFRAAVLVAEALMVPVQLHFSGDGEPLFVRVFGEAMNGEMVIATTEGQAPPVPANSSASKPERPSERRPSVPAAPAPASTPPLTKSRDEREQRQQANVRPTSVSSSSGPVQEALKPVPAGPAAVTSAEGKTAPDASRMRREGQAITHNTREPLSQPNASTPPPRLTRVPQESTQQRNGGGRSRKQAPIRELPPSIPLEAAAPQASPAEEHLPDAMSQGSTTNDLFLGGALSQSQDVREEPPEWAPKVDDRTGRAPMQRSKTVTMAPAAGSSARLERTREERSEPPQRPTDLRGRAVNGFDRSRLRAGPNEESYEWSLPPGLIVSELEGPKAALPEEADMTAEDSFDYSQAADLIERGIKAGTIAVHGRRGKDVGGEEEMGRSGGESEAGASDQLGSVAEAEEEEEEEALPATQQAQSSMLLAEPPRTRTRGNPSPSPLVAAAAANGTGDPTPAERSRRGAGGGGPARKKFKPMF
ncbi:unnamed protein product [Parajaminaea phylloscopi]